LRYGGCNFGEETDIKRISHSPMYIIKSKKNPNKPLILPGHKKIA